MQFGKILTFLILSNRTESPKLNQPVTRRNLETFHGIDMNTAVSSPDLDT
jgi:hypothetical protein